MATENSTNKYKLASSVHVTSETENYDIYY